MATETTPQTSGSSPLVGQCCDVMMMSPGQRSTIQEVKLHSSPLAKLSLFLLTDLRNISRNDSTNSILSLTS